MNLSQKIACKIVWYPLLTMIGFFKKRLTYINNLRCFIDNHISCKNCSYDICILSGYLNFRWNVWVFSFLQEAIHRGYKENWLLKRNKKVWIQKRRQQDKIRIVSIMLKQGYHPMCDLEAFLKIIQESIQFWKSLKSLAQGTWQSNL